jgi:hypothetical protein
MKTSRDLSNKYLSPLEIPKIHTSTTIIWWDTVTLTDDLYINLMGHHFLHDLVQNMMKGILQNPP